MSRNNPIPYTYLVGWSHLNTFYYGVKYGRGANPETFWKDYFTSSYLVKQLRKEQGEPDVIQVRKVFDPSRYGSVDSAQEKSVVYEQKVLRRLRAVSDQRFLNCAVTSPPTGPRIENHKKYRHRKFGAYHSPEGVERMRAHSRKHTKENNPMNNPESRAKHLDSIAQRSGYRDHDHYLSTVRDTFVSEGTVKATSEKLGHAQYTIRHLLIKNFGKEWVESIRKEGLQRAREKQNSRRHLRAKPEQRGKMNSNAYVWEAISPQGEVTRLMGNRLDFCREKGISASLDPEKSHLRKGWEFRKLGRVRDLM